MSETGVAIALGILAAMKELRIIYFRALETAAMTDEQRAELRKRFNEVVLEDIPQWK
jgi:hypothetical protein